MEVAGIRARRNSCASTVRLDGSVLCANDGKVSRLVAAASQPGYDRDRVVVRVGTESVYAVE
jgi:hypothetical protein